MGKTFWGALFLPLTLFFSGGLTERLFLGFPLSLGECEPREDFDDEFLQHFFSESGLSKIDS